MCCCYLVLLLVPRRWALDSDGGYEKRVDESSSCRSAPKRRLRREERPSVCGSDDTPTDQCSFTQQTSACPCSQPPVLGGVLA
jgi:hypothetical protein